MRYIYSKFYNNGSLEMMEVTKAYIKKHGLKSGRTETDSYEAYLDSFETDEEFTTFWNESKKDGARVVLGG